MRPTTFAALTLTTLALAACGGQQPAPQPPPPAPLPPATVSSAAPADTAPAPPPKPSLAEVIPQTMKGIADAFNAHDAKKFASYYTDDAVAHPYGGPDAHGRDEIAKMYQTIFDITSDAKTAPTRVWIKGNLAAVEHVWAGTMTGDDPMMGIKATKKPIGGMRLNMVWFNDDGLIKEVHEYGDFAGVMAQMKGAKGAPPVPTVPTNPPEMHVAKGTPDEDKLIDWAKAMDDTFSKGDAKAAQALDADDAEYWINISGGPATKGKKDMTKELTNWFKAFPDQKWTPTGAWGIDGFAIVEHTMTGTQKGPMGPLAASNKKVIDWHFVDILQPAADGKMQRGWGYTNLVEMMMQTGAIKPPPAEKAPAAAKMDAAKGGAGKGDKADGAKGDKAPKAAEAPKTDMKDTAKKK